MDELEERLAAATSQIDTLEQENARLQEEGAVAMQQAAMELEAAERAHDDELALQVRFLCVVFGGRGETACG